MARSSNKIVVPEARQALDNMKLEIASELGLSNYNDIDKGTLTTEAEAQGWKCEIIMEDDQDQYLARLKLAN